MKILLILTLILMNLSAFALSPGGVMICGKKPTLYSFYEGGNPNLHNIKLWKDDKKIKLNQYLLRATTKMNLESPKLYQFILPILKKVQILEVGFITRQQLPEIPFVDKGCRYQDIAELQYDGKFLFVDMDFYPRLSPMGQAGVIIQEALYRFMADTDMEKLDPDFVRKYVAKLFSEESVNPKVNLDGLTPEQKKNKTLNVCINKMDYLSKGINLFVNAVKICKTGRDEKALKVYSDIKNFMQETIDECKSECMWDEGVKSCSDFEGVIQKQNVCD